VPLGDSTSAVPGAGVEWPALFSMMSDDQFRIPNNAGVSGRVRDGGSISSIGLFVGTVSGNISLSTTPASPAAMGPGASRVVTGAVACPSSGDQTVSLGATVTVLPGDWIGMSCDNTTATFPRSGSWVGQRGMDDRVDRIQGHQPPNAAGT
jgi:hypothetical protein